MPASAPAGDHYTGPKPPAVITGHFSYQYTAWELVSYLPADEDLQMPGRTAEMTSTVTVTLHRGHARRCDFPLDCWRWDYRVSVDDIVGTYRYHVYNTDGGTVESPGTFHSEACDTGTQRRVPMKVVEQAPEPVIFVQESRRSFGLALQFTVAPRDQHPDMPGNYSPDGAGEWTQERCLIALPVNTEYDVLGQNGVPRTLQPHRQTVFKQTLWSPGRTRTPAQTHALKKTRQNMFWYEACSAVADPMWELASWSGCQPHPSHGWGPAYSHGRQSFAFRFSG
jgi:hypothetical protein